MAGCLMCFSDHDGNSKCIVHGQILRGLGTYSLAPVTVGAWFLAKFGKAAPPTSKIKTGGLYVQHTFQNISFSSPSKTPHCTSVLTIV